MDGKETFDTCCGSLCTLIILAIVAGYALFQVRLYQAQWAEIPVTHSFLKRGHFTDVVEIQQQRDDFYFAIAITAKQDFQEHTTEAFQAAGGFIDFKYVIVGGAEDGKVFDIGMAPCSDFNFYKPTNIDSLDRVAQAHMVVPQFFCPSAFDLSFYGAADDTTKKVLFIDVKIQSNEYLEGKHIAMLVNTKDIEFENEFEDVSLSSHTEIKWMPINSLTPMSNMITFKNQEFWKKEKEFDQYNYQVKDPESISWISIDETIESIPYAFPVSRPTVKGQILFQTSHDLKVTVHLTNRLFFINIVAWTGGAFIALTFAASLFFKLWVAWLMHFTIVRNLFKIDPSKERKPKAANRLKQKDAKLLLAEAKTVAKKRVSMSRNCCDRFTLLLEAVVGTITCKATKFGKILAEGKREIQEDLNIYNYMQKLRMLQGTINALTTFNQRRLLMHQVETSFLLKPFSSKTDPDGERSAQAKRDAAKEAKRSGKKKRILDSDDESSEEDFFFLEKVINDGAELDDVDRKLLMGIVQAPPKEKKRWDKEDPAEIRKRRKEKAIARGEHWSDSYDDETDGDDHGSDDGAGMFGTNKDGSGIELIGGEGGKNGKQMMSAVTAARNKAMGKGMKGNEGEIQLECPDGYDAIKWASMSRKEKMKVLGITEEEWNKMTREQQMRRMTKLAHGFHFYSMNKNKF